MGLAARFFENDSNSPVDDAAPRHSHMRVELPVWHLTCASLPSISLPFVSAARDTHNAQRTTRRCAHRSPQTSYKYQKALLSGWTRSGLLRKPDVSHSDLSMWKKLRGDGVPYHRRYFELDGSTLRYFNVPHDADTKPVITATLAKVQNLEMTVWRTRIPPRNR